jgi:hypothetical protein
LARAEGTVAVGLQGERLGGCRDNKNAAECARKEREKHMTLHRRTLH